MKYSPILKRKDEAPSCRRMRAFFYGFAAKVKFTFGKVPFAEREKAFVRGPGEIPDFSP